MKHRHADIESTSGTPQNADRRQLMLTVLTVGVSATLARKAQAAPRLDVIPENTTRGYRETDHVRDYYASTRLRRV